MISTLGIILLLIYFAGLVIAVTTRKLQIYKVTILTYGIIVSLFINLGNFVLNFSFSEVAAVVCLCTCFLATILKGNYDIKCKKHTLACFLILILAVLLGFANCAFRDDMPYVLAMDINMDQAYYGLLSPVRASITEYNRIAFMDLLLFALVILAYKKELQDRSIVKSILDTIRKAFHVLFLVAFIEFVFNNFVSPELLRNVAISLVGTLDEAKTYYPENRFGYYGITLLFSEQSYVAILIMYYAIVWKLRINNKKEFVFYILSIGVLIMSGCSTGIVMLPLALVVFLRECIKRHQKGLIRLLEWSFAVLILAFGIYIIVTNPLYFAEYLDSTILKIGALLQGGQYTNNAVLASGATRNYANGLAIEAFLSSPLFGVGVGGTRGYGIWAAFAATFGIVGMVAFVVYINNVFQFSLKGKVLLSIILAAYFSIILSVWYLYMLAFIPIYLCLQKE